MKISTTKLSFKYLYIIRLLSESHQNALQISFKIVGTRRLPNMVHDALIFGPVQTNPRVGYDEVLAISQWNLQSMHRFLKGTMR